jgi:hypothetical protein
MAVDSCHLLDRLEEMALEEQRAIRGRTGLFKPGWSSSPSRGGAILGRRGGEKGPRRVYGRRRSSHAPAHPNGHLLSPTPDLGPRRMVAGGHCSFWG